MLAREKYQTGKRFSLPNKYVSTEGSLFSKNFRDIFAQNTPTEVKKQDRKYVLSKNSSLQEI
jgi:hypothetical protein